LIRQKKSWVDSAAHVEARNWLEGYLESYPHAFVLVSHDRYFLDCAATRARDGVEAAVSVGIQRSLRLSHSFLATGLWSGDPMLRGCLSA